MTNPSSDHEPLDPEVLELIQEFVTESREVLSESEPELVALEDPANDPAEIADSVSAVFRLFHSMKGSASSLGLDAIASVTHAAESLLTTIRDERIIPSVTAVDALCRGIDCVSALLAKVEENGHDAGLDDMVKSTEARLVDALAEMKGEGEEPTDGEASAEPVDETPSGTETISESDVDFAPTPDMIEAFVTEANEQIDSVESFLIESEKAPTTPEQLAQAFRYIHSVKGHAGFLGLEELERVAHVMEDLLSDVRAGTLGLRGAVTATLLRGADLVRDLTRIADLDEGQPPPHFEAVVEALSSLRNAPDRAAAPESIPMLGELLVEQGIVSREVLDEVLRKQIQQREEALHQITTAATDGAQEAAPSDADKAKVGSGKPRPGRSSIRVDLEKLDALVNQVGELITAAATVSQREELRAPGAEQLFQHVSHLCRITGSMHDTAMSMRMVPVAATFRKVLRVVRDVSNRVGKRIDVKLEGMETEVDKTLIEAIADPLLHLVRNAVDHGIELPRDREQAGKSPVGTVTLSARHEGGEVLISIQDDGGGIDPAKLIARAKARGIVPPTTDTMPRQEAYELLFKPGFSTAEQVTDISGRGVGMDVVRRNIEAVRGRVLIDSELGSGSTFTIRIPLTLAIIDGMLVRVGRSLYAVPLLSIRESVRVGEEALVPLPSSGEMVRIRESVYSVVRLHELHSIADASSSIGDGILMVLEDGGHTFCLFVDELVGQRQIVIKALDPYISDVHAVSGCSVTGTGEICLILDIQQLASGSSAPSGTDGAEAA